MTEGFVEERDLSMLVVPRVGAVDVREDLWEPVRLIDPSGVPLASVTAFLNELQASGRSAATQRSYAMDLLRWFRFGWAIGVGSGDAGGGTRLLQVAHAAREADDCGDTRWPRGGRRAESGDRQAWAWPDLCDDDAGALGDGAACLLRLPPRRRHGADGQSVPAVA